ncbi:MAG TPA: hypothetical protein VH351_20660 [Bryobacteraceae bacterium]|nr:hypothetical protein [Bryobacteraceae bacterium]
MAETQQFDPFENDEEVELDTEELRIVDERCREIDEGRARMLTSEEAREHFRQWLSSSSTTTKR